MIFNRKRTTSPCQPDDDAALRSRQAEADREYRSALLQEEDADSAVEALERTRLRNGFAPAILAGIINNRGD